MCKQICLILLVLSVSVEPKLLMVSTVFGPGAEVPFVFFKEKEWNSIGKGQLSPAGLRSQYALGLDFSKTYQDLLKDDLVPGQLDYAYHQSTVNIQSASAFVTGGFRSFPNKIVPFPNDDQRLFSQAGHTFDLSEINYQTPLPNGYIPVELEGKNNPNQVRIMPSSCKKGIDIQQMAAVDMKKNIEGAKFEEKIANTINRVLKKYAYKSDSKMYEAQDLKSCVLLASFGMSDYFNSPDSTFELSDQDMIELRNCYSANMASNFMDKEWSKTMVSPFLLTLKDNLEKRSRGDNKFKLNYYSLRQEVLYNLALAGGVTNSNCIFEDFYQQRDSPNCWKPVGQSLSMTWELHQIDTEDNKFFVRTLFNGSPINFCHLEKEHDEFFDCSLSEFSKKIDSLTRKDYEDWCKQGEITPSKPTSVKSKFWQFFTFIMTLLIFILGGIGFFGLREIDKMRKGSSESNLPERPTLDYRASASSL